MPAGERLGSADGEKRGSSPSALIAGGAIVAGLLLLAVVVLLAMTWSELRTSRENIEEQNAKASALLEVTEPALDEVPSIVERADPVLRRAAPLFGKLLAQAPALGDLADRAPLVLAAVQSLANEGIPLAQALRGADLPALVADLRSTDLPSLVAELRAADLPALAEMIREGDIPRTLDTARSLIEELNENGRLAGTLDVTRSLLTEVSARQLPRRAVKSTRRLHDLLRVQRDAYDVLVTSLRVQRRLLERVRSIDEKFLGPVPTTEIPSARTR